MFIGSVYYKTFCDFSLPIAVFIQRETKQDGRTERISIDTDHQVELEFPPILCGSDKLQRK